MHSLSVVEHVNCIAQTCGSAQLRSYFGEWFCDCSVIGSVICVPQKQALLPSPPGSKSQLLDNPYSLSSPLVGGRVSSFFSFYFWSLVCNALSVVLAPSLLAYLVAGAQFSIISCTCLIFPREPLCQSVSRVTFQKDWSLFVLALTSVLHSSHLQGLLCHIGLHLLTSILHASDAFNSEVEAPS
jgi:hypothetical protein